MQCLSSDKSLPLDSQNVGCKWARTGRGIRRRLLLSWDMIPKWHSFYVGRPCPVSSEKLKLNISLMSYLDLASFLMQNEKMKYHQEYLDSIRILEEKWKVHQQSPKKQVHSLLFYSISENWLLNQLNLRYLYCCGWTINVTFLLYILNETDLLCVFVFFFFFYDVD